MSDSNTYNVRTAIPSDPDKIVAKGDSNHHANCDEICVCGNGIPENPVDIEKNISDHQHYPENRSISGFSAISRAHNSGLDSVQNDMEQAFRPSVVNRVIDSLHLRRACPAVPTEWLLDQVRLWEAHFEQEEHAELYVQFGELGTFRVKRARRPYAWTLINPEKGDIHIWNPAKWDSALRTKTGQLYLDFRSKFLQFEGIDGVWAFLGHLDELVFDTTERVAGPNFCLVARLDLAVDVQLQDDLGWADLDRFVTRAALTDTFLQVRESVGDPEGNKVPPTSQHTQNKTHNQKAESYLQSQLSGYFDQVDKLIELEDSPEVFRLVARRRLETIYFGKFGGQLYARAYNKLLSLQVQDKAYMLDVWAANGWTCENPVWRMEFSLSGEFLKEMVDPDSGELADLRSLAKVLVHLKNIWAYLTARWLRHCDEAVSDRTHTTRYRTSDFWVAVQAAWAEGVPVGRRRPPCKSTPEHLVDQAKGCLLTAAAKVADTDGSRDALRQLIFELRMWAGDADTVAGQALRRKELGVDDASEEALEQLMHFVGLAELDVPVDGGEWSDAEYSTMLRAERMIQGFGS